MMMVSNADTKRVNFSKFDDCLVSTSAARRNVIIMLSDADTAHRSATSSSANAQNIAKTRSKVVRPAKPT